MGGTDSSDFPVAGNPFQPLYGGNIDAFVAKLNPAGTALAYATYLGGSGEDYGFGIVVDAVGQVYVTGWAASPDFPVAGNPFQPLYGGNTDAFVAKIVPDTLPPEISIIATPETLWPPNGRTVSVTIVATITDAGSGGTRTRPSMPWRMSMGALSRAVPLLSERTAATPLLFPSRPRGMATTKTVGCTPLPSAHKIWKETSGQRTPSSRRHRIRGRGRASPHGSVPQTCPPGTSDGRVWGRETSSAA